MARIDRDDAKRRIRQQDRARTDRKVRGIHVGDEGVYREPFDSRRLGIKPPSQADDET